MGSDSAETSIEELIGVLGGANLLEPMSEYQALLSKLNESTM